MKPRLHARFTNILRISLAFLVLCTSTSAGAADFASLIAQAREQLLSDRFIEGLAAAKDAVRAKPNDYKGHYYVAMAYMGMERYDEAIEAVNRALTLAPTSSKTGVEKLADAINTRRAGRGSQQAAEAALAEGLAGKAARLFEQAWNADQSNYELGLKTADLYANRLGQLVDAARVLRSLELAAKGNPAADRAVAELRKLSAPLRQIAEEYVKAARGVTFAEALRSLQKAEEADPTYAEIYTLRAWIAAKGESVVALQKAIKDLAQHGHATPEELATLPHVSRWMRKPAFDEFLVDLLGSKQAGHLRRLAPPDYQPGQVIKDCDICPEMMAIPEGGFVMGSDNGDDNEKPAHYVNLKPFAMSKTEVTHAQWVAVMHNHLFSDCGDDCPMVNVTQYEAQAYARFLSEKTGKQYRLPSEAEWEYACRAGGNYEYCGSGTADSMAWHGGNSGNRLHRVGEKQANAWGLYDMSGNAWEWVEDCKSKNYTDKPNNGSAWVPSTCEYVVIRGGSYSSGASLGRVTRRTGTPALSADSTTGFRVVRTLP